MCIYKKHQAFNLAHSKITSEDGSEDGFTRPKKYHHNPEKLADFTNYVAYFHWATELYASSVKLISLLRKIYDDAEVAKSSWYQNKDKLNLNRILDDYSQLKSSLNDLYDDVHEFQNCMLITNISEKQAQIEALSDQIRALETLEKKIIEVINRKLYEINSTRVTYANAFIALAALVVSILSILYSGRQNAGSNQITCIFRL